MAGEPVSLLVGFGWGTFPLKNPLVSHNEYLDYFFTLGAIGLVLKLFIYFSVLGYVRSALRRVSSESRSILIGFVFGFLSVLFVIFFVNLYAPWNFIWMMAGAALCLAAADDAKRPRGAMSQLVPENGIGDSKWRIGKME